MAVSGQLTVNMTTIKLSEAPNAFNKQKIITAVFVAATLGLAYFLGVRASWLILAGLAIAFGGLFLLHKPHFGLFALILSALLLPLEFDTGTAVTITPVALVVPALALIWLLYLLRQYSLNIVSSTINKPLVLFLLAGLLSLAIGSVLWDPSVPRSGHFVLVQLAQWAIFAFSAGALWLTANLITNESWLHRLAFFFLLVAGVLAIIWVLPGGERIIDPYVTISLYRAPFWYLLAALAGGQLLFNKNLSLPWRLYLVACLGAVVVWAFFVRDDRTSYWTTTVTVLGLLLWLRHQRLGWAFVGISGLVLATGALLPFVYEWAGGDAKWFESGGARIALITRTIEVTMQNPITGLGPAAYRLYANQTPLIYGHIVWFDPLIASHNNYVDLFSHVGILGTGIFFWFMLSFARLAWRLRAIYQTGFAAGFINGMLAAWAASLVAMMLADWFLPFVYNIQFTGFQASVLVWLFMGGVVVLERLTKETQETQEVQE